VPVNKKEFQSIQSIKTIPSILEHGILSNENASKIPHVDISMKEMQEKRDVKSVPHGMDIHKYATLYFDARNPMMGNLLYIQMINAETICVLRVSIDVLKINGTVIADQNVSSKYVSFLKPDRVRS